MFQSLSWDKFNSSPPLVVQGTLPSGFNPSVGISLIQAWCCHRRSRVHFLFQSLSWDKFNSSSVAETYAQGIREFQSLSWDKFNSSMASRLFRPGRGNVSIPQLG